MIKRKEHLNKHIEHLEDVILWDGVAGLERVQHILKEPHRYSISTKWDGAPSIFAGTDPSDGRFFVATKGIFAIDYKIYKANAEIDAVAMDPELRVKLKLALFEFAKLDIKGIIQGDFLYARENIKEVNIDGTAYITFHPNTLVYAVPRESDLAKKILASRIGVVWHTAYRGEDIRTMSASFGETISKRLKEVESVWHFDAVCSKGFSAIPLKDDTPNSALQIISAEQELSVRILTFINDRIRNKEPLTANQEFFDDMQQWIFNYYQKAAEKRSTAAGKQVQYDLRDKLLGIMSRYKEDIMATFKLYNKIATIKQEFIGILNKSSEVQTFILSKTKGYRKVGHEGHVLTNGSGVIKLVNRQEFSNSNFSTDTVKGWEVYRQ